MPKLLTVASIRQMKPGKSRREIADGGSPGLYLHVQPSGRKSWAMLLRRPNGKIGKLHLGPVDLSGREAVNEKGEPIALPEIGTPLTLSAAHALAAELHRRRAAGMDVISARKVEKEIRKAKADEPDSKFAAVAEQFIDEHARPKTRRWRATAHLLGLDYQKEPELTLIKGGLAERWHDREIAAITSHDVYALIIEVKKHGVPGLPRRTDGVSDARGRAMARALSKLFAWCLLHRKIMVSPSVGVYCPPAPAKRKRVLEETEIIRFWHATDKIAQPLGPLLKLLLLTGCRLREVSGMVCDELSDDGSTWTVPSERTKNKLDFIVPLPPLAREILRSVKVISGNGRIIFTTTGKTPVSGFSKTKKRLDAMMKAAAEKDGEQFKPWRLHDLRRTFSTLLNESAPQGLGVQPHIVEALLNHSIGGVAGVYNRALYLPEKTAALKRWSIHIDGMIEGRPANVTPLRGKKRKS